MGSNADLGFVSEDDVVVHGGGQVINAELQLVPLCHSHEARAGPGGGTVGDRPANHWLCCLLDNHHSTIMFTRYLLKNANSLSLASKEAGMRLLRMLIATNSSNL